MDHRAANATPSKRGNPDWFTGGAVWQDPINEAPAPARLRTARVNFEPGARTVWHTHPLGQTLHVISGTGRIQAWGGPLRELKPGDSVWIPPHEKHWHGASPQHGMVHIAMHEALDGNHVSWLEPVTDDVFNGVVTA